MAGEEPAGQGRRLDRLEPGQPLVFGGDQVALVSEELAAAFRPGDRLVVVQDSGALLHIPAAEHLLADSAVVAAHDAFLALSAVPDAAISAFFGSFADRLEDDAVFAAIAEANADDVRGARAAAGARPAWS